MINTLNTEYFEKVQARETIEQRMPVKQREQIRNTIVLYKAQIAESTIKLEMLDYGRNNKYNKKYLSILWERMAIQISNWWKRKR